MMISAQLNLLAKSAATNTTHKQTAVMMMVVVGWFTDKNMYHGITSGCTSPVQRMDGAA